MNIASDQPSTNIRKRQMPQSSKLQKPKQLSVILVCDYSLSYMGGAQVAFIRQVKALLGEGWSVVVIAPGAKKALEQMGTPLLTIIEPKVKFTLPGIDLPIISGRKKLAKRMNDLLAAGRVRGVIVHSEFSIAAIALRAGRANNVPVLQTVHTFFWRAAKSLAFAAPAITLFHTWLSGLPKNPRYKGDSAINNALRSMTLRLAARVDAVLSPSKHQAVALRDAGANNVHAFSNVSEPVTAEPPVVEGPLQLVWAGRFAPEKRLHIATDAMRIVTEKLGDKAALLHVAGTTGAETAGVQMHGKITTAEVASLIDSSHAVLITSLGFDNQPMIALEGFAKHRPVIVTDPVLKEEFGEAAIATPTPDAVGLAATVIDLVKNPELITTGGHAAGAYARERVAEKHAARLSELLNETTG